MVFFVISTIITHQNNFETHRNSISVLKSIKNQSGKFDATLIFLYFVFTEVFSKGLIYGSTAKRSPISNVLTTYSNTSFSTPASEMKCILML